MLYIQFVRSFWFHVLKPSWTLFVDSKAIWSTLEISQLAYAAWF